MKIKNLFNYLFNQLIKLTLNNPILYYLIRLFHPNHNAIVLNIDELKKSKKTKNTIFIMGSGYSINKITKKEWQYFKENGEILSFNLFFKGNFVDIDYQVVGEIGRRLIFAPSIYENKFKIKSHLKKCYDEMVFNPRFNKTIFFLLNNRKAFYLTLVLYSLKIFKHHEICFFNILNDDTKNAAKIGMPSSNLNEIPHNGATLFDAINIAYILGYQKIVLVGVDLYDRRYFWLKSNETRKRDLERGGSYKDVHITANKVLKGISIWKEYFDEKNIELYNYNPKSLLKEIIPLYLIDQEQNH